MSHSHLHLMLQEGINLLRSGDLVQAESIFAGILKSNPKEIHSLHLLGVTLCEMGRIKEGISLIEHSINLDSSRFSPFLNLGKFLFQDAQYTSALSALKKAIEKDQSSFDAWHLLAKTYFFIDDLSNAIKSAKKAASFRSDDANILFLLGFYTSIIDKSSAIAYYELCISFNPSFFQAYVNIADLYFDLNAYENAYINYQKALEFNFDCFQALMGIVRIYAHRLQWDECYKFAKQAYQTEPTSFQSLFWFATSLYQLNRPNEAIKIFYKALDINPDSARTHFFLACSLEASAQQTTALFHYEKATELDNQFAEAFFNWGLLLFKIGLYNDALEKYLKTIHIQPNHAECLFELAVSCNNLRDYNKAIKYLVQAIDTKPGYIEAIALLASVYRHSKQTEKAIITYKNVLATNSRHVNAIAGLGWSYIESTDPDLGIEYYNKLLSVSPNDGDALFFLFEIMRGDLHKKLGKRFSYSSQFLEKSLLLLDVQKIVAFGDSHVKLFDQCDAVDVHHVGASTAFNLLENDSSTGGRNTILTILKSLSTYQYAVLLCFGEVDIRANVIKYCYKSGLTIQEASKQLVSRYVAFANEILELGYKVIIYGGYGAGTDRVSVGSARDRNYACKCIHELLSFSCKSNNIIYFSLHSTFFDESTLSTDPDFLLDSFHLYCNDNISRKEIQTLLFRQLYFSCKCLYDRNTPTSTGHLVLGNVGNKAILKTGWLKNNCLTWDNSVTRLESIVFDLRALVLIKRISIVLNGNVKNIQLDITFDGQKVDFGITKNSHELTLNMYDFNKHTLCISRYPALKGNSEFLMAIKGINFDTHSLYRE